MAQVPSSRQPKYKRILLKLSGEALMGTEEFGIDPKVLDRMALEVGQLVGIGVQVGLVIGGGNLFRGAALHAVGMDRVTGDHMGMLATVMNGLAMRDALERSNIQTRVMSAITMEGVTEHYDRRKAMRYLAGGDVVIFSAGTGNPFFTTDTAATLRALEIDAELGHFDALEHHGAVRVAERIAGARFFESDHGADIAGFEDALRARHAESATDGSPEPTVAFAAGVPTPAEELEMRCGTQPLDDAFMANRMLVGEARGLVEGERLIAVVLIADDGSTGNAEVVVIDPVACSIVN